MKEIEKLFEDTKNSIIPEILNEWKEYLNKEKFEREKVIETISIEVIMSLYGELYQGPNATTIEIDTPSLEFSKKHFESLESGYQISGSMSKCVLEDVSKFSSKGKDFFNYINKEQQKE